MVKTWGVAGLGRGHQIAKQKAARPKKARENDGGRAELASGYAVPCLAPDGARATQDVQTLLALQRSAGNAAVRAFVQRAPGDPVEHITAPMFTVTGGDLQHPGTVTAQQSTEDPLSVGVTAPSVTLTATVVKKPDAPLGPSSIAQVGTVQTLNNSRRVGVYHLAGDPFMPMVTTKTATVTTSRDAQWDKNEAGEIVAVVPEPWYSKPDWVTDESPSANVNFEDKPGFDLPRTIGSGILTEIQGVDSFTTSIAAKRNDDLIHLKNQNWSVDWRMNLSFFGSETGHVVSSEDTASSPSVTTGPIVLTRVNSWMGFPTVEAAMGADSTVLLASLLPAKKNDEASYNNIVAALKRKNPRLRIWLTVASTAETFGADEIEVTLAGDSRSTVGPTSLNDGDTGEFDFDFNNVVDPSMIEDGYAIEISAADTGLLSNEAATTSWHMPLAETDRAFAMSGGGGKYKVMAQVIG